MRQGWVSGHLVAVGPHAYLLTFSTYGTHLPGSEKGSVDVRHCIPGSPMRPADSRLAGYWRSRLGEEVLFLDEKARLAALKAILDVCRHRGWVPYAVHVRSTHVHGVVSGEARPERMLFDFKAYATRALRLEVPAVRRRYWTDHGSTRYLWNEKSVRAAMEYVLEGQGLAMARYPSGQSEGAYASGSVSEVSGRGVVSDLCLVARK